MAFGTLSLAEKNLFATGRIARKGARFEFALQNSQIRDNAAYLRGTQRMEGGHSGAGKTTGDNLSDSSVGQMLRLRTGGDVGSSFAASAIEPVTPRAAGAENALAGAVRPGSALFGATFLRLRSKDPESQ